MGGTSYFQILSILLPLIGALIGAIIGPWIMEWYRRSLNREDNLKSELRSLQHELRYIFGMIDLLIKTKTDFSLRDSQIPYVREALSRLPLLDFENRILHVTSLSESFFKDLLYLLMLARQMIHLDHIGVQIDQDQFTLLKDQYNRTRVLFASLYREKLNEDILTATGMDAEYSRAESEYIQYRQKEANAEWTKSMKAFEEKNT